MRGFFSSKKKEKAERYPKASRILLRVAHRQDKDALQHALLHWILAAHSAQRQHKPAEPLIAPPRQSTSPTSFRAHSLEDELLLASSLPTPRLAHSLNSPFSVPDSRVRSVSSVISTAPGSVTLPVPRIPSSRGGKRSSVLMGLMDNAVSFLCTSSTPKSHSHDILCSRSLVAALMDIAARSQ